MQEIGEEHHDVHFKRPLAAEYNFVQVKQFWPSSGDDGEEEGSSGDASAVTVGSRVLYTPGRQAGAYRYEESQRRLMTWPFRD